MEKILKFVEECVSTFYSVFNYGKSVNEKMLPYCRPSVEKFIFNKLYFILIEIYNIRYFDENNKFSCNQEALKKNYTINEILDYLEVNYYVS